MSRRTVSAAMTLGGAPVQVASMTVREVLSEVTHARVEIASMTALDPGAAKGGGAEITFLVDDEPLRRVSLVVGKMAFDGERMGSQRFAVDLYSPYWLLRHTRGIRKFRNLSAQDIVSQVLGAGGVAHQWKLQTVPPVRKYCVQYRESHFDFVNRLLEFEGIYYRVEADGSLALEDTSSAVPSVDGKSDFDVQAGGGALAADEMVVFSWGSGARVGTGKVSVNDFSWKTPDVELLKSASAGADAEYELYNYPEGYRKPGQGAALAQRRLEACRARTQFFAGGSNVVTFMPGKQAVVDGQPVVFVEVEHTYQDPRFSEERAQGDATPLYSNRFEAIPAGVPFRPPMSTPRPAIDGCHTAMVVGPPGEEIHTDRFGRFRAKFHWDREATGTDEDSRWLRKLQEGATSVNLARVGWEVSVAYIDGDPDRPVGLARDINGVMVPAYAQPADKPVMTIKTPTYPGKGGYNEIKLDDRAGAQQFNWRAENDWLGRVNHDRTEKVGRDETHVTAAQLKHRVKRDQTLSVGANQDTTIESKLELAVGNDRTVAIGGNQKLDVGATFNVDVQGNQSERVGSLRLSIVGSIQPPDVAANAQGMVPSASGAAKTVGRGGLEGAKGGGGAAGAAAGAKGSLQGMVPSPEGAASQLTGGLSDGDLTALASGSIERTAVENLTRLVGAVHLAAAADTVGVGSKYVHAEVVGGAKITLAKEGYAQSAGKVALVTVGGAYFKKAGKDAGYNAKDTKVTVGGLAKLTGVETVELTSKTIRLNATQLMRLVSKDLKIIMEPAKIAFEGNLRLEASEKVTVTGKDDNLTKAGE